MKMTHIILAMFLVMGLEASADSQSESYSKYQQCVESIHRQVVDLTAADDLVRITNFIRLYLRPNLNLTNALRYIDDPTNDDVGKMIVVYSLQGLSLNDYVDYEKNLLYFARDGRLSKSTLNEAILPALDWSTKIQVNFERPNVRSLLKAFINSDLVTAENKQYFREVLSGQAKKDVIELEGDGLLPKRSDN